MLARFFIAKDARAGRQHNWNVWDRQAAEIPVLHLVARINASDRWDAESIARGVARALNTAHE